MCSYSTVSDWLGARFFLERPPARKFLPTWEPSLRIGGPREGPLRASCRGFAKRRDDQDGFLDGYRVGPSP